MLDANKLLLAKLNDLANRCVRYQKPMFSAFLDGGQLAYAEDNFLCPPDCGILFFGGYADAERKMAGLFPEWHTKTEFPVSALEVRGGFRRTLGHRDYLGTLMSLGIKREKTGDILTFDNGAYIFLSRDIAEFAAANIKKIANEGVSAKEIALTQIIIPEKKRERVETVCASLRLDAVVSAAYGLARKTAAELISQGMVKVNHRDVFEGSKNIFDNDLVSVRGFGRFLFGGALGVTRKKRLHIVLYKYI